MTPPDQTNLISSSQSSVRLLDQTLVNQIAAGEVIERPASAIKELVENAIDAGSTKIDLIIKEGGKTYISVADNGSGMNPTDLQLCVERHATSKIPDGDLFNIRTLGFRGEALPSIGSVSRLTLTSRRADDDSAWQLLVEGGVKSPLQPANAPKGTRVEVRDLFFATPVRLKFLKTSTTELNHITDMLYRQALVNPQVEFSLRHDDKSVFKLPIDDPQNLHYRLDLILGKDFIKNALPLHFQRGESVLTGWISIPSYNKSHSTDQYIFVNGRPVKDKLLSTAVKIAYQDVLSSQRYAAVVLFLTCDPEEVDVNVHPAKAEVRFRDPNQMRGFFIAAIREVLQMMDTQSASTIADKTIASFTLESLIKPVVSSAFSSSRSSSMSSGRSFSPQLHLPHRQDYTPLSDVSPPFTPFTSSSMSVSSSSARESSVAAFESSTGMFPSIQVSNDGSQQDSYPLGFAKAQIQETYIIAETNNELILVDQHAAHERLVYEKFKKNLVEEFEKQTIRRQALLIPTIIELTPLQHTTLSHHLPLLEKMGFVVDLFGQKTASVREIPVLLTKCDLKNLFLDLIGELQDQETSTSLEKKFYEILADKACRHSIRAGRKLSIEEMNALLRQIEQTPHSSQCNHGRPTYIKLSKTDLEKLFERA